VHLVGDAFQQDGYRSIGIGKGAFHYEDLLCIPMIVRWPGRVPDGVVSDALQSQVDFPQTFLSDCGIAVPGWMQGVD
jgi:arylsulfatase A-like enzyme